MSGARLDVVIDAPASQVRLALDRMRTVPVPWVDRALLAAAGRLRPSLVTWDTEAVSHTVTRLHLRGASPLGLRLVARRVGRRARHYLRFGVRTGAATVPLRPTGSRRRTPRIGR